jgi:hypothetical protein
MIHPDMTIKYNGTTYKVLQIVRDEFLEETFYIVDLIDGSGSVMVTAFDPKTPFEVININVS